MRDRSAGSNVVTSGSRRTRPGRPWRTAGRAGRWGLVGVLLGWLLSACMATAAPPIPTPEPVAIIVGIVTEPVRWHRPGHGSPMIWYYAGPSVVSVHATTPILLHTIEEGMQQVHIVSTNLHVAQGMLTALHAVPAALSVSTPGPDGLPPGYQLLIHYCYPYDPLVSLAIGELDQRHGP